MKKVFVFLLTVCAMIGQHQTRRNKDRYGWPLDAFGNWRWKTLVAETIKF